MKERGIIFNGDMVRAILDGRKTQTRRALTKRHLHLLNCAASAGECYPLNGAGVSHANSQSYYREFCPFGQPGDRLWVRETFQGPLIPEEELSEYLGANPDKFQSPAYCEYAADGGAKPEYVDSDDNTRYGWRPSIHMPRWASRITLKITGVRVEPLNDISETDAIAEGFTSTAQLTASGDDYTGLYASDRFADTWQSIYGAESWNANSWCWAITFRRIEGD